MRGKLLIINFVTVILAIIAIAVFAVNWSKEQHIESVTVSGSKLISSNEIQLELSDTLINHKRGLIKLQNIQKLLKQNPYIRETYITHNNLNELQVELKERIPSAILELENGELAVLDEELAVLPYKLFEDFPDLPIIKGIFDKGQIDSASINGAVTILNQVSLVNANSLYSNISEIIYKKSSNTYELITAIEGIKVILGKLEDIELKIDKLDAYLKESLINPDMKRVKYLDLRWGNHIIAGKYGN